MRIINMVRERASENWSTTDSFIIEDHVTNPEEAIRNAIKDYLETEEGKKSVEFAFGDFNWGDAMMDVKDEYFEKYGIRRCEEDVETIIVNQDEILFPEIQNEILGIE